MLCFRALFPCGDSMVCIIDDREDVWNMATNLIQVKPYHFFQHTGDINAPPGMSKHELDGKGVDFKELEARARAKLSSKADESSSEKEEEIDVEEAKEKEPADGLENDKTESKEDDQPEKAEDSEPSTSQIVEGLPSDPKEPEEEVPEAEAESKTDPADTKSNNDKDSEADNSGGDSKPDAAGPCTKTTNELPEDNLIEIEDPDDYLLYLETSLKKIHQRFYAFYDEHKQIPDLKSLIPKIRSEVLLGKVLVFSGLVPTQVKLEKSRAYLIARSLGATVTQQLTDETTHLVASTAGTFKVNAARKMSNIRIVSPEWLWTCAERWECVEEKLFPLDSRKSIKARQPPAHCHSPGKCKLAQSLLTFVLTIRGNSRARARLH